jgi:uncharacterized protein YdhG (YjbR/CyaY superfamily)
MPDFPSVDDYIAAQPPHARPVLERVRATVRRALPGATEGISYQIPVVKLDGRMVLYFAGFERHYSLYPATARVLAALGEDLGASVHGRATIRFPYDTVPVRLIARFAKLRAAEVAERETAKRKPRSVTRRGRAEAPRRTSRPRTGRSRR